MKPIRRLMSLVAPLVLALNLTAGIAQSFEFHSEKENTLVLGSQDNINHIKTSVFDFTCEGLSMAGSQGAKTSSTQTIQTGFAECHVIVLFTFKATPYMNECDFDFNANGDVSIKCPAGKRIEFVSAGCNVSFGPQTIKSGAEYVNSGAGIRFVWKAKGVKYHQIGPSCATKEGTDAEFSGSTTLFGTSGGNSTKIWWG